MLKVSYNTKEVWKRIIPFQAIPAVGIYIAVALSMGKMQTRSPAAIEVIFFLGFLMYCIVMAFLIQSLLRPDLLTIADNGDLTWRPAFTTFKTRLPVGTEVSVKSGKVMLTPIINGIPTANVDSNATIIKLPAGVEEEYDNHHFTISA